MVCGGEEDREGEEVAREPRCARQRAGTFLKMEPGVADAAQVVPAGLAKFLAPDSAIAARVGFVLKGWLTLPGRLLVDRGSTSKTTHGIASTACAQAWFPVYFDRDGIDAVAL